MVAHIGRPVARPSAHGAPCLLTLGALTGCALRPQTSTARETRGHALTPSGIAHDRAGPRGAVPVVLLHAGVADRRMWDPQWAGLTGVRDAVRLDLRGFGESDRPPAGSLDPAGDVLGTLDHARRHVVPPRGVLVRGRGGRRGRPDAARTSCAPCCSPRPVAACSPNGPPSSPPSPRRRTRRWPAATSTPPSRPNVDAWVVGEGRTAADVDPAVTASVRVMQRRAFDIDAAWGDLGLDFDEVELDPPAVERYAEVTQPVLLVVGRHDLDTVRLAADAPRGRTAAGAPRRPPRRGPPAVDGGAGGLPPAPRRVGHRAGLRRPEPLRRPAERAPRAASAPECAGRGAAARPAAARAPGPRRRRTGAPRRAR